MTTIPRMTTILRLAPLALVILAAPASSQTAVKLEGTCEKLVIAGQDLSGACRGSLTNTVSRNRTSFDFTAEGGRTLSFAGSGAQQERTEETDPLQPINLVIAGKDGSAAGGRRLQLLDARSGQDRDHLRGQRAGGRRLCRHLRDGRPRRRAADPRRALNGAGWSGAPANPI